VGSFSKIHCVPFAEAIPFWEFSWMKRFMGKVVGMDGGWTVGTDYEIFSIPLSSGQRLSFATPICFEISYDDECRIFSNLGADALFNLTNVSWSQTVSAEIQHTITARYRAIENRKPVVLSTNGGLSCWFDEKGYIHEPLPFFTPASRPITVSTRPEPRPTIYDLAGNSLALGMVFFFAIFSGAAILYLRFSGRKDLGYGRGVLGERR
jgi:apolipoprotein N-acyltransferase